MKNQQGSAVIILVMIIVLLGGLYVTVWPRFFDMDNAVVTGVAGAATMVMTNNYESCAALNHNPTDAECIEIDNCDDIVELLVDGSFPEGYTIVEGGIMTENGETDSCTLIQTATSKTANYTATAAGLFN